MSPASPTIKLFPSAVKKNSRQFRHFSFLFCIFVPNVQDFCQSDKDNEREMRVIDLINSNEKTAFSFEILPPLKGTGIEKLYQTIDTLREFDPKYINITTHRSEYVYKDLGNGLFQRNRLRRRPGARPGAAPRAGARGPESIGGGPDASDRPSRGGAKGRAQAVPRRFRGRNDKKGRKSSLRPQTGPRCHWLFLTTRRACLIRARFWS